MNISLFKNFTKGIGSRTLPQIVEEIRGDRYKDAISKIRKLVEEGDTEKVSRLKKGLEAFTVSGLFEGGRKMSFLKKYNPFVILDIDKLDPEDLPDLILKVREIPFTRVAFISPSGRGLKIIVEVDSEMKRHGSAYWQVMNFYKDSLMVEIDKSGKDITRLCFMSYDPEIYYKEESTIFNVLKIDINSSQTSSSQNNLIPGRAPDLSMEKANLSGSYQEAFTICVTQTNTKLEFKKGNRNNYIYQLGVNCSHAGIPLEIAIIESMKSFDFDNVEIEKTLKSAYNWKPFPLPGPSSKTAIIIPAKASPVIPDKVFDVLPAILKKGCKEAKSEREKDVFLTGAFGVLSGALPNVTGIYDGDIFHSNLFVFVVAPAASGKGALKYAKRLGEAYHAELIALSKKEKADFKKAYKVYKTDLAKFEKEKLEEQPGESQESQEPQEPEEPISRKLFIPANTSSAMLMRKLERNGHTGVLFESEADTLANVLKQDWGNYSDSLRKAFHHETISYDRKSNGDFIEIEIMYPKLSVVLSGTPDQVMNLIPSTKNGLFSRFIFYSFESMDNWRDVSREANIKNFHTFYQDLGKEVSEMISFLETYPTDVDLTKRQWKKLNETFDKLLEETRHDFGDDATSLVKRLGLICFRLVMILSAVRKFEEKNKEHYLVCKDDDFEVAICLAKVYWDHALLIYDGLPSPKKTGYRFKTERVQLFFNALPDRFMRKEADAICSKFDMVPRTGARYLKELLEDGHLSQSANHKYGEYFKTPVVTG